MVIYITNRTGDVLTLASTDLPNCALIIADNMTDEVSSGVKTYEVTLEATDAIRSYAIASNYLLADGTLYTIITSEYDNVERTVELYCEDAGLDLINRTCGSVAKTSKTFADWITNTLGNNSGWTFRYGIDKKQAKTLEYSSDQSAIERLHNILTSYGAEMYFTYTVDGLKSITRTINFVKKRGVKTGVSLYAGKEISVIKKKESIEELATVWKMFGKDNKVLSNLTGYASATKNYPKGTKVGSLTLQHDYDVTTNYVRCKTSINKWKSTLDTDGVIMQVKYTEYANAQDAINYALREMEKIVDTKTTYEATLVYLPDGLKCGDYINILDAHNAILLSARIIKLQHSYVTGLSEVELGNYATLKGSKAELNQQVSQIYTLSITSSAGLVGKNSISTDLDVSIYLNGSVILSADELPSGHIVWYEDGVLVPDTDPRISSDGFRFSTGTLTQGHTYKCVLEE